MFPTFRCQKQLTNQIGNFESVCIRPSGVHNNCMKKKSVRHFAQKFQTRHPVSRQMFSFADYLLIYSLLLCIAYTILKQNSAKIPNLKFTLTFARKKIIFQPITALVFEMPEMYPLIFSITKRNIPRFFQAFLIQMVFCYPNCSDLL